MEEELVKEIETGKNGDEEEWSREGTEEDQDKGNETE